MGLLEKYFIELWGQNKAAKQNYLMDIFPTIGGFLPNKLSKMHSSAPQRLRYDKIMSDLFTVIVLPSLAVITIAILFFLVRFIYKALTTWTYYEVSLEEFNEYYDRLINYYREYSNENQDPQKLELLVVETFEKDLTEQLMKCENHNREVNMARNAYIKYFMQTLPLYIVSVALLALPNF